MLQGSYDFSWSVLDKSSGNQFGHTENRLGYDTSGAYHVLLPDGRTQTVTYTVDPYTGFQAKVDFAGEATYGPNSYHHGAYHHPPKPVYSPYKSAYQPQKPVYSPPKPVYTPYKPAYQPSPKPVYHLPQPLKPVYQTAATTYHQTFSNPQVVS